MPTVGPSPSSVSPAPGLPPATCGNTSLTDFSHLVHPLQVGTSCFILPGHVVAHSDNRHAHTGLTSGHVCTHLMPARGPVGFASLFSKAPCLADSTCSASPTIDFEQPSDQAPSHPATHSRYCTTGPWHPGGGSNHHGTGNPSGHPHYGTHGLDDSPTPGGPPDPTTLARNCTRTSADRTPADGTHRTAGLIGHPLRMPHVKQHGGTQPDPGGTSSRPSQPSRLSGYARKNNRRTNKKTRERKAAQETPQVAAEYNSSQAATNPSGFSVLQLNPTSVTPAVEEMVTTFGDDAYHFQETFKDLVGTKALLKRLRLKGYQCSAAPAAIKEALGSHAVSSPPSSQLPCSDKGRHH